MAESKQIAARWGNDYRTLLGNNGGERGDSENDEIFIDCRQNRIQKYSMNVCFNYH